MQPMRPIRPDATIEMIRFVNTKVLIFVQKRSNSSVISQAEYTSQTTKLNNIQSTESNICSQILTELASNLKNQEWKNLHILPVNQPRTICGPPTLTHNIGALLLAQCSISKNVILLIEHSSLMSEGDLTLAQITAKTVIDMLSETDFVTVIGLAGSGSIYCKNGLLSATDINKYHLTRHIDSLTRIDSNKTLEINLTTLVNNIKGDIVIIHFTNKLESSSKIKQIVDQVSSINLTAYFRTILILSDQEPFINSKDILKDDTIIALPTHNILGYEIAKLFSGLKCLQNTKNDYYLSDPYFEPYNKGMILSVGLITNIALLSLDVKLQDFVDDIIYFNLGPGIYAVLFDTKEIVWMHKYFPRMENILEQPLKVYMQNIENIDKETISIMIRDPQGYLEVTNKINETKQYRWKHLDYEDLIICIVSTGNDPSLPVAKVLPILPKDILHHRLDLMSQTVINKDMLCFQHDKIITLSMGVVYLSPWCFQSPMEQLKLLETGSVLTVQSYMAYIKDLSGLLSNPGLHQFVRPDVATLAQILNYFKIRNAESVLNKFIIRRYIVSATSGVLEIFPGMVLDSGLDPKRRAWYGAALEHHGKIVLTPPYLDAGGSGYIVTLSHTVYEGRSAALHSNKDPVMAVVAMDITMGYISRLLLETYPFCNDSTVKCFLMDDKGYLVSHPSLLQATGKVEHQHLTHKELLVANDILNHEFFVKKKICANYLDGTVQRYYQFNTSLEEVLTNIVHGEHCVKYQVAAVPGTNIFLGVVNVTCNLIRAFCPCSTMDRTCLNCHRMEQTECECPCECSLYSSSCSHQEINNLKPCPASYEQGASMQTPWMQPTSLKSCPSFNCKAYETEAECLGIVGCQWCHVDSDGDTPLPMPFCSDMPSCFKGIFGSPVPFNDGTYNSQSTDEIATREWPSVGPVAGGILAFVLIVGVTIFCYRLRSVHSGLEHQCLHLHTSPDTLRMTHLDGDHETMEIDQTKNNLHSLMGDGVAPISPYRVSTNYRRPPGGDSDHGYSTMTPHDDSEQQTFIEPLLIVGNNTELDLVRQSVCSPSPTTNLDSPHHVLASVTVHRNMETNFC
ncbi:VWFA and cache domain-containing protein 1 isoform X2 [Prorops nasuta]|uniref:VWFA and cache domain-containing protein 1 isoform X2 n=1 Tax=Prorops nasuta TaxID=863751 RepID=UPI0034CE408B